MNHQLVAFGRPASQAGHVVRIRRPSPSPGVGGFHDHIGAHPAGLGIHHEASLVRPPLCPQAGRGGQPFGLQPETVEAAAGRRTVRVDGASAVIVPAEGAGGLAQGFVAEQPAAQVTLAAGIAVRVLRAAGLGHRQATLAPLPSSRTRSVGSPGTQTAPRRSGTGPPPPKWRPGIRPCCRTARPRAERRCRCPC